MFIAADQILAHLVGDYLLQSDWMANEKRKNPLAAAAHALTYAIPFLFFRPSLSALLFIALTHYAIDHFGLARFVIWAKNRPWPGALPWADCTQTGYPKARPDFLAVWLMIIADNTLHLLCNGIALKWL